MKKKCILFCIILSFLFSITVYAATDEIKDFGKNFEEKGRDWEYYYANYTATEASTEYDVKDDNIEIPTALGEADDYKMFKSLSGEYIIMRVKHTGGDYFVLSLWDKEKHCLDCWVR